MMEWKRWFTCTSDCQSRSHISIPYTLNELSKQHIVEADCSMMRDQLEDNICEVLWLGTVQGRYWHQLEHYHLCTGHTIVCKVRIYVHAKLLRHTLCVNLVQFYVTQWHCNQAAYRQRNKIRASLTFPKWLVLVCNIHMSLWMVQSKTSHL